MKHGILAILAFTIISVKKINAQPDELLNEQNVNTIETIKLDEINNSIEQLESDNKLMKKLKLSGVVQAQYQKIDSAGAASFAGGNFASMQDHRLFIRRGRLKAAYEGTLSQAVIQLDATEKGITLKDAYLKLTDPWSTWTSLTAGVFNRPFGYEIEYSSSLRESPERSRIIQSLFPGERDMGAMITLQAPKTSSLNFFKLDAGFFNGSGPNNQDFDNKKDFIGRLNLNKSLMNEALKISGGASYYKGGYLRSNRNEYSWSNTGFIKEIMDTNSYTSREFKGFDFQLTYDSPLGITILRAEYIWGINTATSSSNTFVFSKTEKTENYLPKTNIDTTLIDNIPQTLIKQKTITSDAYKRVFHGYYIYLVQNILQTRHQLTLKYDYFDPNIRVSGKDIGVLLKSNTADIAYATIGLGYICKLTENVKFMAYYDLVTNEKTTISGYGKDLKDNVITLRLQYKF